MIIFTLRIITISSAILVAYLLFAIASSFIPHTIWFDYKSVEPVKTTFAVGEPLEFTSMFEVYRPSFLYWTDTVRCETQSGASMLSVFKSDGQREAGEFEEGSWTFNAAIPLEPAACEGQHDIRVEPLPGVKPTQTVYSSEFYIR